MTTNDDPRLTPAHQPPTPTTTGTPREEVKDVAAGSSRSRRKRAWDEMSETDRAVLLETVRQRRAAEETKRRVRAQVDRARMLR